YDGGFPVWAKAQRLDTPGRVVERIDNPRALADFVRRTAPTGVSDFSMERHVEGTQVKIYGVAGTPFARFVLPDTPEGAPLPEAVAALVGDEFPTPADYFRFVGHELATALGIDIYGADAIVGSDGMPVYFDFNDFPSYAPCAAEAAEAVVKRLLQP
ncbi:MAG: hypothetical protein J6M53_02765, partial [Bacteroidaceae bacterium]|nr:hypothetical protein [Bacteroidaceae bacterium]